MMATRVGNSLTSTRGHGHAKSRSQSRPWLPVAIAGVGWRSLLHIREHRPIMQFMKAPGFVEVVQNNPKFCWKYLTSLYLANGLTVRERAACFLHHYRRLQQTLPETVLKQVLHWTIELLEFRRDGRRFRVTMGLSRECDKEGEISLTLQVDGENFYTLSFTIIPGWVVASSEPEVLLISRLQGVKHPTKSIRDARKGLNNLPFGALLLSALEGIAVGLGVNEIVCVSSKRNVAFEKLHAAGFKGAYEDLFAGFGIHPSAAGFLVMPLATCGSQRLRSHSSRARLQKTLLQSIRSAIAERMKRMKIVSKDVPVTIAVRPEVDPSPSIVMADASAWQQSMDRPPVTV